MFQIRESQVAAVRRTKIGCGLLAMFAGAPVEATPDPQTDDIGVRDTNGNTTLFAFAPSRLIASITSPMGRNWIVASDRENRATAITDPTRYRLTANYQRDRIAVVADRTRCYIDLSYDDRKFLRHVRYADKTSGTPEYYSAGDLVSAKNRLGASEHYEVPISFMRMMRLWSTALHQSQTDPGMNSLNTLSRT